MCVASKYAGFIDERISEGVGLEKFLKSWSSGARK